MFFKKKINYNVLVKNTTVQNLFLEFKGTY